MHEFKKAMEQDNRDLVKEQTKLTKLANEAGEICKSFLVLSLYIYSIFMLSSLCFNFHFKVEHSISIP